jgi:hypothetical protein
MERFEQEAIYVKFYGADATTSAIAVRKRSSE